MTNMSVHTMAAIRNARGLSPEQKAILYTVESRGEVYSTVETLRADCGGMGRDRFYRHRNPLVERGLLRAASRGIGRTTRYRVDREAVEKLVPPGEGSGVIVSGTPHLPEPENEDTPMPQNEDAGSPQNHDTAGPRARTQREPQSGPRKWSTQEDQSFQSQPEDSPMNLKRFGEPVYLRLVRTNEMSTQQKHGVGEMTPRERWVWNDTIERESSLA